GRTETFEFLVDDVPIPWNFAWLGVASIHDDIKFHANVGTNLAPGTYRFSLNVTSLSSGSDNGSARAQLTYTTSIVPLPASAPFLAFGLAALGLLVRRKAKFAEIY